MSYKQFQEQFPNRFKKLMSKLPPEVQKDLETDPLYIVRITENNTVEIGYRTDEWIIK